MPGQVLQGVGTQLPTPPPQPSFFCTLFFLISPTQPTMAFLIHTKDTVLGITLNGMYKFIHFRDANNTLVFCYSVKGQQIALQSLLIIPPFVLLGWHDAMWMTCCHFKVTITLITRFHDFMEASILNFLKRKTIFTRSSNFRNKVQEHAITFYGAASICSHICQYLSTPGSYCHQDCTSSCWHWHGGLFSFSDILPLRFLFFYLSTLPSVFFYNPSLMLDISHHFSTS